MKKWFVWAALWASAVVPVRAGIQAGAVPADAKWVMHLDLKALNGSPMGRFIRQSMGESALRGLASLQSVSGINLTNDVDSLVVFGTAQAQTSAVMVVSGRFDVAKLTAIAGGAKEYQNKVFGEHSLLSWSDKGKRTNLCFADPTVAVLSQDENAVRAAVTRMDAPGVGAAGGGAFGRVLKRSGGRFLAVQANDVAALSGANPQIQMFKQAEAVLLEVGQLARENGLDVALSVKARTEEMAQQFSQAAQGLQALFQLQAAQNPDVAELAQGAKVGLEGDVVSISLAIPEERLRKLVQARMAQQQAAAEARRAARQAKRPGGAEGEGPQADGKAPARPAFE